MSGVPVNPMNDALGSAKRMLAASVSYWERWASSVMTTMSSRSDNTGIAWPRSGEMNLWISVNTYRWSWPKSSRR